MEEQTIAPQPMAKKRKKWPAIIAIFVVGVVVILAAAWYAIGTPHYSMYQLQQAFEQNDVEAAQQYVDIDALSDQVVDAVVIQLEEEVSGSEGGLLSGLDLGGAVLDALMPQIQSQARDAFNTSFEESVKGESEEDTPFSKFADEQTAYKLQREGDVYLLTLTHPEQQYDVVFRLEEAPGRIWKIVAIQNLEDIVDNILSEQNF